jgi:hypothetical protein
VVGDGPVDLLLSPGFVSRLDLQWTSSGMSRVLARLASFAWLIIYDKPGTGLSDPVPQLPSLEEPSPTLSPVLDAAGSERAVPFGISDGGPHVGDGPAALDQRLDHGPPEVAGAEDQRARAAVLAVAQRRRVVNVASLP